MSKPGRQDLYNAGLCRSLIIRQDSVLRHAAESQSGKLKIKSSRNSSQKRSGTNRVPCRRPRLRSSNLLSPIHNSLCCIPRIQNHVAMRDNGIVVEIGVIRSNQQTVLGCQELRCQLLAHHRRQMIMPHFRQPRNMVVTVSQNCTSDL